MGCLAVVAISVPAAPFASGSSSWQRAPVVPTLTAKQRIALKARVRAGHRVGLRPTVFAKVGDSNTEFAPNFYGLACRRPAALPRFLRRTLRRYNRVRLENPRALPDCRPSTSFSRRSTAAQAGVYSTWSLTPSGELPDSGYLKRPEGCEPEATPLDCELDATRPRYALVMLGSNDLGMDIGFGVTPGSRAYLRLQAVARALLSRRVVPVLTTIPPVVPQDPAYQELVDEGVARTNSAIWRLSRVWRLPMVNLWRALNDPFMLNRGLADDGLHLSVSGADGRMVGVMPEPSTFDDSVDFRRRALRFGANRHNLIWLKTLARLDRITG